MAELGSGGDAVGDIGGAGHETVEIRPITGLPELRPGDDLAGLLCAAAPWLRDGDILVVTSKAVSKVEGQLVSVPEDPAGRERARQEAITEQTVRIVAERGATKIVETRHGWVMAAAGVDASNVVSGEIALLPIDSDASARRLRAAVLSRAGVSIAVVVSDTNGRPWRRGLVDVAVGVAGMSAIVDMRGTPDTGGVPLQITEIALADELASAADLVKGKLIGVPAAVVRGLALSPDDGVGAAGLRRTRAEDMFALGTRDVVPSRQAPETFGPGPVPEALLHKAVEAAAAALPAASDIGVDVLIENPWRAKAPGLLGEATAAMVPELTADAAPDSHIRLGMLVAAVLIQLHAEGLAAEWLPPGGVDGSAYGVIVVGQPVGQDTPAQMER